MLGTIADIASLIGIFTSTIAVLILVIELRSSRLALQTQTLLELEERLYSREMKTLRQIAAQKLLKKETINSELEDTLDFFHSVVMLIEKKVVNRELAFEFYKYWIARYWMASKEYISDIRKIDDPNTYKKFESLARAIIQQSPEINYSDEAMRIFLMKEAGLNDNLPNIEQKSNIEKVKNTPNPEVGDLTKNEPS